MRRFRSILSRVVALHLLAIGITAILMPLALYWLLNQAANSLHRDALRAQARTIAGYLARSSGGEISLNMPPGAEALYSGGYGLYGYAILDAKGKVLFSSRADGDSLSGPGNAFADEWLVSHSESGTVLIGVNIPRTIGDRLYWIQVGQDLAHRDVIIDDIVTSFFSQVAWITFPILSLLLLIDIAIFRRALRPLRSASETAAAIGPERTDLRLPETDMPNEILPLVHAVNRALARLEEGFRHQREFTADMAHELRTPLAIMRARVDAMNDGALRESLTRDITNMARTVNQVLDMAELDAFVIRADARADLHAVCAEVIEFIAPLAVENAKTISLIGADAPVWVRGHDEALFRAVRNLVENAIRHTPPGGSIDVDVNGDGTLRVMDGGTGVQASERQAIFKRFWRRDRASTDSSGIGLAIVDRVVVAHGGTITVDDRPGGGAVFTVRLQVLERDESRSATSRLSVEV